MTTKDEIKNRISMALRDPVLQQGFEIICKENAELKDNFKIAKDNEYEYSSLLTKAKEILRGLYFIVQGRIDYENNTGIADEMWRAEQFLKG